MTLDSKEQRRILGKFATGVTVASTKIGDETWGMTANAVTSLSLEPPLVILCIQKEGQSRAKFEEGGCFALNILSVDQQEISDRFAFKGPKDFSGLDTTTAKTGAPILKDALGWVDCQLKEILPGGDHDIFVGEIVAGGAPEEGSPLLYFSGKYAKLPT
ncbi:MAG: flavin reductase family protein [Planctomycetaceae bacterium]|nr:flavin reductase family protein [Planctomycetales bacterium]MCB9924477.1 flavin reductase family protein [Planctomycetaceae bacterium]